jgi:carbonic anhydrase
MSKAKDTIEELRAKLFERKKQETIEESKKLVEANFDQVVYDVIQNPDTKSRSYLIVRIKYDIKTKEAVVTDVNTFEDKTAGLTMQLDKENKKYLFEKSDRSKK